MTCLATRLIASSRIVKLIFVDPILVVVTVQTISIPGKSVSFRGKVIGASPCGNDKIIVLSADGVMHLYDLNLRKIISKTVGLPNEWAGCEHTVVTANSVGSTIAFGSADATIKVYSIAEKTFNYVGSVIVHEDTKHCIITNGLPGAPGLLLAFTQTFVKVVEISPMMPTVSTVRVSNEPILHIYPMAQDGDCVLITGQKVRVFGIRDVLIGKFEFPVTRLPGPLVAASSTRLKSGIIHNMVICGSKLFELSMADGKLDTELICRLNAGINPTEIEHLFCLSGAGLWLVRWFGRGTRGQFMINEDKELHTLDPEYELDFDALDFQLDTMSNSIVGFGRQPNIDFISRCLVMNDLIEPLDIPMVSGVLYEPEYKLLFVICPTTTHVFTLTITDEGLRLKEIHTFEGKILAASSIKGICTCVFEDKRIFLAQYSFNILDTVPFPQIVLRASTLYANAVLATVDNKVYSIGLSDVTSELKFLFELETPINSLRYLTTQDIIYSTENKIMRFSMFKKMHFNIVENPVEHVNDIVCFRDAYYSGYRDGYIGVSEQILPNHRSGKGTTLQNKKITKLNDCPVEFASANDRLFACGAGIWIFDEGEPIPIVRQENKRHEPFNECNVAGIATIPYFDLTLVVAYNNQIRILSTEDLGSLISKPQVDSLYLKSVVTAVEKGTRFRSWILATGNGLEFFDMKHRTQIKSDTDLSSSEAITALVLWDIELGGTCYTHLAIGTSRPTIEGPEEYLLRSCSIKREKNLMIVKKRLKTSIPQRITSLTPFQGRLLVTFGSRVQPISIKKECGISVDAINLNVEGKINDLSIDGDECLLSTSRGLVKANLSTNRILSNMDHMVNRMRDCKCHLKCTINNREVILLAQKDCFVQVMEFDDFGTWRVVQRLDAPERILRMHHIESTAINLKETIVVALTTIGSFVQLKIGEETVEAGPYLF